MNLAKRKEKRENKKGFPQIMLTLLIFLFFLYTNMYHEKLAYYNQIDICDKCTNLLMKFLIRKKSEKRESFEIFL